MAFGAAFTSATETSAVRSTSTPPKTLSISLISAAGSMNHLAFNIAADKFDDYVQRLTDLGLPNFSLNHDDSAATIAEEMHDGVFVRSVYFRDPDGILLEMACWTKAFDESDAQDPPAAADGTRVAV